MSRRSISEREAARLLYNLLGKPVEARRKPHKPRKGAAPSSHTPSAGEAAYSAALALHGADLPAPALEYVFAPPRRWRFDFAWPAQRVAVEIDGGQWKAGGGRHNTDADREKLNQAAALGWRVVRFSPAQVKADPEKCIAVTRAALEARP